MANKHTERCLTSFDVRETQNHAEIPAGIAVMNEWITTSVGEDEEELEPSCVNRDYKNSAAALESSLAAPQNVKHRVTIWPSNSTPKRNENMSTQILVHEYSQQHCS